MDEVASSTMATFHGCGAPCIDAVAVAATVMVLMPNTLIKKVGTLAVSVILMALAGEL